MPSKIIDLSYNDNAYLKRVSTNLIQMVPRRLTNGLIKIGNQLVDMHEETENYKLVLNTSTGLLETGPTLSSTIHYFYLSLQTPKLVVSLIAPLATGKHPDNLEYEFIAAGYITDAVTDPTRGLIDDTHLMSLHSQNASRFEDVTGVSYSANVGYELIYVTGTNEIMVLPGTILNINASFSVDLDSNLESKGNLTLSDMTNAINYTTEVYTKEPAPLATKAHTLVSNHIHTSTVCARYAINLYAGYYGGNANLYVYPGNKIEFTRYCR